uniref:EGF-like domain-containing protein n=1 Tax=Trichobilharzia regenti TaxID=157069 RepID=A0AA85JV99_TRIRE|nr:unnamed protein product [Trichobilharzia regenti]
MVTDNDVYLKYLDALCLTACYSRYKENLQPTTDYYILCPYPCIVQKDCSFYDCKDHGIFSHEYECPCSGLNKWDTESIECLTNDLYEIRQSKEYPDFITREENLRKRIPKNCESDNKCYNNGTLFCTQDPNHQYTQCVCKLDHHGYHCQDKIDACLFHIEHHLQPNGGTLIAGNRACNINNPGNKCISITDTYGQVTYQCQCNESVWIPDINLPYPNCMQKLTKCDSLICLNGYCISNDIGDKATCICDHGYTGSSCDEWVGEWSEWSIWDKCRPACGHLRYSVRERECLSMKLGNESKQCLGSPVEFFKCSEHPCNQLGISYLDVYFEKQQNVISVSLACGAVVCAILIIIWILLCYGSVSSVYQHYIEYCMMRRQIKKHRKYKLRGSKVGGLYITSSESYSDYEDNEITSDNFGSDTEGGRREELTSNE